MADKISDISRFKLSDYRDPRDIMIEKVEFPSDFRFHWHEHYEVEYVLSGSGTHTVNGKSYPMRGGSLHFIVPTDFHELKVDEPITMIKFVFDENAIDLSVFGTLASDADLSDILLTGNDRVCFDALFSVCELQGRRFDSSPHYPCVSRNLLECVLLNLAQYSRNRAQSDPPSYDADIDFKQVLVYLHRNFKKPISLSSVAEYSHFSTSHLSRLFHKTMGVTFKEYLTELRMNFAAKCLQNTDASVTEICYEAGFGSLSGFITEFRRRYGLSPTAYKKQFRH